MAVDENFARVILRDPRKITVNKNHTWDKMRFFKISHYSVIYKKCLKIDPINVTCYWVKFHSSAGNHSKDAKKRLKNDPVTWVNLLLFLRKISVV